MIKGNPKNIRNRPAFEAVLPYILFTFVGYCVADVVILSYRDLMLPTQAPPSRPSSVGNRIFKSKDNYYPITSRNIFSADGLIPDAIRPAGEDPKKQDDQAPVPSNLPLALQGTIVHSNPAKSIANIEVKSKNEIIPYVTGREIANIATLVKVERRKIIIRNQNNGRLEYIEMKEGANKLSFSAPKESGSQVGTAVVQTAPNKYEIKATDLNKYLKDANAILQQAATAPVRNAQGEIVGFKFVMIQPGSVYTQLGFQIGDTLKAVNGEKIDSIAKAMEMYGTMRANDNFKILIERDGREIENDYSVKK